MIRTKKIVLYIVLAVLIAALLLFLAARVSAYTARLLIHEGMKYETITKILGSEGKRCDVSIIVYEWSFPDGSVMTIWLGKPTGKTNPPKSEFYAGKIEVTRGSYFQNPNPA